MTVGFYLILSGLVLTINYLIIGQQWWLVPFAGWFFMLGWYRFATKRILFISCLAAVTLYFSYNQLTWLKQAQKAQILSICLVTHPEWYQVNDGYLRGYGFVRGGRGLKFTGRITPLVAQTLRTETSRVHLQISGEQSALLRPKNRYGFDEAAYWRARNVIGNLKINQIKIITVPASFGSRIVWLVRDSRYQLINWFEKLPAMLRDYGQTLILGYTRQNFYYEHHEIRQLGLIHLFSISGFQVTLITSAWAQISRIFQLTRETRLIIGQGWIILLGNFAGEVQALIRAVIAGILTHWRELGWFRLHEKDIWGLTLIISLILKPTLLLQLGGQLSFLLSWGLMWVKSKSNLRVSFFLGLLIAPVIIWHTASWHPLSLFVNSLVIPVFTYGVIPITLLGIVSQIGRLSVLVNSVEWVLIIGQNFLRETAKYSKEIIFGQPPILWVLVTLLLITLYIATNNLRYLPFIFLLFIGAYMYQRILPIGRVTFFDVGQGDATLICQPNGEKIMVDLGGRFNQQRHKRNFDVEEIIGYCHAKGITKIDHLVLTHQDFDHIGNFMNFVKRMPIKRIYIPAGMKLTKALKAYDCHEVLAYRQMTFGHFLAPQKIGDGGNEGSIVLYMQVGPQKILLTGDLGKSGERDLLQRYQGLQADILKIGHHGSKTSSDSTFVRRLQASNGVISAGRQNRYGHPHAETLRTLRNAKMSVFSTAEHGMIEYTWWCQLFSDKSH
ncbi:DNA internalization-related competence protein ComEC/Rec2 [Weissella oryzae]|nr:DNA internalization-related competence protein ComEC/Rec2 [Weissella oryzae]